MNIAEIESLLANTYSPREYCLKSEIYGLHYFQGKKTKSIKKVLLTLDLNLETIHFAVLNKTNLIISHHGLFEKKIDKFSTILIKKLNLLSKYPISIFVLNTPYVAAKDGISDTLIKALYLRLENIFYLEIESGLKIPIGRICVPRTFSKNRNSVSLGEILNRIKTNLNMDYISYVGNLHKEIEKFCIIGGNFIDEKLLLKAKELGCDCYVSFKIGHTISEFAREIDLALIQVSHYQVEVLSLKKLSNILSLEHPDCEFTFYESNNPQSIYL